MGEIKKLFIVGNGFDCYGHRMKTKYSDFKDYLVKRFPEYNEDFDGMLASTTMPDGDETYDMDEVVGSIIRLLNDCAGQDWGILEASLGYLYIESIIFDNEWAFETIDFEADDGDEWKTVNNNENISENVTRAYAILRKLFEEWVFEELGTIDYFKIKKIKMRPLFINSFFLNFNYTITLEELYRINRNKICHIHGDVEHRDSEIYFGHGDTNKGANSLGYIGIEDAMEELFEYMRKDTKKVIEEKKNFFEKLNSVKKIYTYGFSFSDVDMIYIEEIAKRIEPTNCKWYFNRYDWKNNKENINKVKELGFKVRKSYIW